MNCILRQLNLKSVTKFFQFICTILLIHLLWCLLCHDRNRFEIYVQCMPWNNGETILKEEIVSNLRLTLVEKCQRLNLGLTLNYICGVLWFYKPVLDISLSLILSWYAEVGDCTRWTGNFGALPFWFSYTQAAVFSGRTGVEQAWYR